MTTQAIAITANSSTLAESIANELQKAKQVVVNIRSLENLDQQVLALKKGSTVMCPW